MQLSTQYDDHLLHQYNQFLGWVVAATLVVSTAELSVAWLLVTPALGLVGISTLLFGATFTLSRWLLRQGQVLPSVVTVCIACCITPILYMLAMPDLLPVCALFPIAAVGIPMLFPSRPLFRSAIVLAIATGVGIASLAILPPFLAPPPPLIANTLNLTCIPIIIALLSLLFGYVWHNAITNLLHTQAANRELHTLKTQLEAQVVQRTGELQSTLATVQAQTAEQTRLLDELGQQREVIRGLSVPVLPVSQGTLVMPLVGALDTARLRDVQEQALRAIERTGAHRLLLDITGVAVVDSQVAQGLVAVVQSSRLLGAAVVLIGIRPEVAQTIVDLGLNLSGIRTASNLQAVLSPNAA